VQPAAGAGRVADTREKTHGDGLLPFGCHGWRLGYCSGKGTPLLLVDGLLSLPDCGGIEETKASSATPDEKLYGGWLLKVDGGGAGG
jgi:hypothetical protein